ncbi:MAG: PAS domain S-box protein, partial [Thermodesulfobacteriota bacterium]
MENKERPLDPEAGAPGLYEASFRPLFENVSDAVFFHDLEGNILEVNDEACRRLGYTRDEMPGMNLRNVLAPESAGLVLSSFEELRVAGRSSFEVFFVTRGGGRLPALVKVSRVESAGQPTALSVVVDLGERKAAQEALQESEEKYRAMMEALADPVYICS